MKPMKTLLLVGGYGRRLRESVSSLPKPMAEIAGSPFLEYLLYQLKSQSFNDFIFCVGYLADTIQAYFGDGSHWSVNIDYSREEEPLGTAGAIKLASRLFSDDDFLVVNGDSLMVIKLHKLIDFHFKRNALATIAVTPAKDIERFGKVVLGENNRIAQFSEKSTAGHGMINGGIYVINRKVLDCIPDKKFCSLENEIFPQLVDKGCYGMVFKKAFFIDIGTPESYLAVKTNPDIFISIINKAKKEHIDVN
ncbi:MAG: nucleotidyltransferase family protein [bacterium]